MILCSQLDCPEPGTVRVNLPQAPEEEDQPPQVMLFCQEHSVAPDWETAQTRRSDDSET